jgi:exonuclease III
MNKYIAQGGATTVASAGVLNGVADLTTTTHVLVGREKEPVQTEKGKAYTFIKHKPRMRVTELKHTPSFVVWPRSNLTTSSLWDKLKRGLRKSIYDRITKISEANRRDTSRKHRLYVYSSSTQGSIEKSLLYLGKKHNWGISPYLGWKKRGTVKPVTETISGTDAGTVGPHKIKVGTWNINSIKNKIGELRGYLQKERIDVVAIQETRRRDPEDYAIRLKGFTIHESPMVGKMKGQSGIALAVNNKFPSFQATTNDSPYHLAVQVQVGLSAWIFVNIYLPPRNYPNRKEAETSLQETLRTLYNSNPNAQILIMGDWNIPKAKVDKWINKKNRKFGCVIDTKGSDLTYHSHEKWSGLDHFVVMPHTANHSISKAQVDRRQNLSDHWPVTLSIQYKGTATPTEKDPNDWIKPKLSAKKIRNSWKGEKGKVLLQTRLLNHNRWTELEALTYELDEDGNLAGLKESYEKAARDVAEELKLVVNTTCHTTKHVLTRTTREAVEGRNSAYNAWLSSEAPLKGPNWKLYDQLRDETKKILRKDQRDTDSKEIMKSMKDLTAKDSKGFWNWANDRMRRNGKSTMQLDNPIKQSAEDTTLTFGGEAKKTWLQYTANLFSAPPDELNTEEHFAKVFKGNPEERLLYTDNTIGWEELNNVLHKLNLNKACGMDGIPFELFKTAYETPSEDRKKFDPAKSRSPLGRALTAMVNALFSHGIPTEMNEATLCWIYKKEDPQVCSNYRGIALINTIVKLTTLVVNNRQSAALESQNHLIKEQAGFRKAEESVAHALALYEILKRRTNEDSRTYVMFIDFFKAYDTVPHKGMLRKLGLAGICGKTLEFQKSLYTEAVIFLKDGKNVIRQAVPVKKGLRQGCPSSPLNFNVYINDIMDNMRELGVETEGLRERICGLLFADDLVLMCPTRNNLRQCAKLLEKWAETAQMSFGHAKCAVMGFGPKAHKKVSHRTQKWHLTGKEIKVVEQYTYLGICFDSSLSLEKMAQERRTKGEKVAHGLYALLTDQSIPLFARIKVIKACLTPVLTYGSEIWGMSTKRTNIVQPVLTKALKWMLKMPQNKCQSAMLCIARDLDIPTIKAVADGLRTRAFIKFPKLRTVMKDLMKCRPSGRKRTWVTQTPIAIKLAKGEKILQEPTPKTAGGLMRALISAEEIEGSILKTVVSYKDSYYDLTRDYIYGGTRYTSCSKGITWLSKCRCSDLKTLGYLANTTQFIDESFKDFCPFCESDCEGGETVAHILLKCPKWTDLRRLYIHDMIEFAEEIAIRTHATNNQSTICTLLFGGAVPIDQRREQIEAISRIEGWLIYNHSYNGGLSIWTSRDLDPDAGIPVYLKTDQGIGRSLRTAMRKSPRTPSNAPPTELPGYVRIALYLQYVMSRRRKLVKDILLNPEAKASQYGRAVLEERSVESHEDNPRNFPLDRVLQYG